MDARVGKPWTSWRMVDNPNFSLSRDRPGPDYWPEMTRQPSGPCPAPPESDSETDPQHDGYVYYDEHFERCM